MVKVLENKVVDLDIMPGETRGDAIARQTRDAVTQKVPSGKESTMSSNAANAATAVGGTVGGGVKGVVDTVGNTVGAVGEGVGGTLMGVGEGVGSTVGYTGGMVGAGAGKLGGMVMGGGGGGGGEKGDGGVEGEVIDTTKGEEEAKGVSENVVGLEDKVDGSVAEAGAETTAPEK